MVFSFINNKMKKKCLESFIVGDRMYSFFPNMNLKVFWLCVTFKREFWYKKKSGFYWNSSREENLKVQQGHLVKFGKSRQTVIRKYLKKYIKFSK